MYSTGRGIAPDPGKAVEWWRKGAEKENAGCMVNLGWANFYGKGVQKDRNQAIHWLREAADLGNEYARKWLVEIGEIK
jgi:TPR repeat protein